MTTTVINREDSQKEVEIFFPETGARDSIFVQPLGKTKLPEGSEVTKEFLMLNPKVKVITSEAVATPDQTSSTKPDSFRKTA